MAARAAAASSTVATTSFDSTTLSATAAPAGTKNPSDQGESRLSSQDLDTEGEDEELEGPLPPTRIKSQPGFLDAYPYYYDGITYHRYKYRRTISAGASATAIKVRAEGVRFDGESLCMKILKRTSENWEQYEREVVALLKTKSHPSPYIVGFYGAFVQKDHYCIVLELGEQSLLDLLVTKGRTLQRADFQRLAHEIAKALHHLHNLDIIHRDVKPDNVLLTLSGKVLLADLGESEALDVNGTTTGRYGTEGFIAPEIVDDTIRYGPEADAYAYGCLESADASFRDGQKHLTLFKASSVKILCSVEASLLLSLTRSFKKSMLTKAQLTPMVRQRRCQRSSIL
ncbi:G protein-coupled receptor kinase 2 [Linnemannia hyalina]|uniref:mitogen-activated protein kinase kinase n=1 Tax=Linnemannia hyalina TaxID=64524 RepID=A0A9P7Y225_9FUNG|nr:G protein-coupled receptor kinase 2 [Linnemannia hyalina]